MLSIFFDLLPCLLFGVFGVILGRWWPNRNNIYGEYAIHRDEEEPEFNRIHIRIPSDIDPTKAKQLVLRRVYSISMDDSPK